MVEPSPGRTRCGLFGHDFRPRASRILGLVVFILAWGVAIVAASIADRTLLLPGSGRGLLEHYGFQASFAAGPLVLVTAYLAVSYFMRIMRRIDELLVPEADRAVVQRIISPHIDSLFLRARWRNALWLFMFVGAAVSVAIFRQLDAPERFWGNDVFNAESYRYSFFVANGYLLWLWGFAYPTAFFYALHLTLSTEIIIARLKNRKLLRLDFLHIDNCGGMARFGTLNFLVMMVYAWPFGAIYALHLTHQNTYLSLALGAIVISAAFIVQSVYGIYWVSQAIRSEKESAIASLNAQIGSAMEGARRDFSAAMATLEYRDRVLAVTALPYSGKINAAVNVLRFAPPVLALFKFAAGSS